jgi:hypothetical protein
MKIRITQEDIVCGNGSPGGNPIALALIRAGYAHAWVSASTIKITDKRIVPLSTAAARWLGQYLRGKPVNPATFTIKEK